MKVRRILLLLLPILITLAACSPGHSGSSEIAFIRNGQLWTIDPDGANAFAITTQGPPVVGYSWSPTHQIIAFRTLDATFAHTQAAKHLDNNAVTGQAGDIQSTLNTIGVDGGTPIQSAFSSPDIRYSNAIWNASGTRLLYRQTGKADPLNPDEASWIVAQNDQPAGIAAKLLPPTYTIPSFSYTTQQFVALSANGIFTTTLTGTQQRFLTHDPLPGHPLAATLERVLWQPAHHDATILYAIAASSTPTKTHVDIAQVQLIARTLAGHTTTLATCTCTQFAWSPDGNSVLYSTGASYTLLNIATQSTFTLTGEANSIPYWSPDSHFLLLDGPHTLTLTQLATHQQTLLLHDTDTTTPSTSTGTVGSGKLLEPIENNIWAADGRHFLFLTHGRLQWQAGDKALSSGQGLYTATIDDQGHIQGTPISVDRGNDTQAGWTYQDANTSFLY